MQTAIRIVVMTIAVLFALRLLRDGALMTGVSGNPLFLLASVFAAALFVYFSYRRLRPR